MLFKFKKSERLSNKRKFESLFKSGYSINAYPLKIIYLVEDLIDLELDCAPVQFAFTVPKRQFKKATTRNHLKRRMKESFRLNKSVIYDMIEPKGKIIFGIFIYVEKEIKDYHIINEALCKGLSKLKKALDK